MMFSFKLKKNYKFFSLLFLIIFLRIPSFALEYQQIIDSLSSAFSQNIDSNEGLTTFRTLYIPCGGRNEALGTAFTALANDLSFFESNPAASCTLQNSEIGVFHNSWISDSSMDTLAYVNRFGDFGFGAQVKCFYVEFIERDFFQDVAKDYYSETIGTLNFSYNICPGYDFKGLALGVNLKGAYRDMPDYTDNDTSVVIAGSGRLQSAFALMADVGIQMRFNLAKFYSSNEANLQLGISATNFGVAFTNLGSASGLVLDDPLSSKIAFGLSYKPINPLTIVFEAQKPINIFDISLSEKMAFGTGFMVQCTDFFAIDAGFLLRGASPRFSLGSEFLLKHYLINLNYTFDATSSTTPINRFSVSAKVNLGDGGRAERQAKILAMYNQGLKLYAQDKLLEAIDCWKQVLKLNPFYDPAKKAISSARKTLKMQELINQANFFD